MNYKIQRPKETLKKGFGICMDHSVLIYSLIIKEDEIIEDFDVFPAVFQFPGFGYHMVIIMRNKKTGKYGYFRTTENNFAKYIEVGSKKDCYRSITDLCGRYMKRNIRKYEVILSTPEKVQQLPGQTAEKFFTSVGISPDKFMSTIRENYNSVFSKNNTIKEQWSYAIVSLLESKIGE